MDKLLDYKDTLTQIKFGHQVLRDCLFDVKASARSYREVKPKIRHLIDSLLAHFQQQKQQFYDDLEAHSEGNREKLKMLEALQVDLRDIKIRALTFMDAHPADLSDQKPKNFILDYADFSKDILARIKIEENYLLPLLTDLCKKLQN